MRGSWEQICDNMMLKLRVGENVNDELSETTRDNPEALAMLAVARKLSTNVHVGSRS